MTTLEEQLLESLRTAKERVEYILEHYPETRNNDLYLWIIYVRLFCPELSQYIKFIPFDLFKKAPSYETISRVRRKLQESGRFLPTDPKVARKRRKLANIYRKVIHEV
jgi:hypothetical protein